MGYMQTAEYFRSFSNKSPRLLQKARALFEIAYLKMTYARSTGTMRGLA